MTALDDIQTDGGQGSERDDATINSGQAGTASTDEWTASVADEGNSNTYVFLLWKTTQFTRSCLAFYVSDGGD